MRNGVASKGYKVGLMVIDLYRSCNRGSGEKCRRSGGFPRGAQILRAVFGIVNRLLPQLRALPTGEQGKTALGVCSRQMGYDFKDDN